MNLALHLLGYKGYYCLNSIVNSELLTKFDVTVVIGKDSGVSNDYSNEIRELCESSNLKIQSRGDIVDYRKYEYVIAIGWRWLIKNVANEKLIVFHDSLLPKYRGFAPLVNAALNRESKVGVTALFGAEEYDKGDIIEQSFIDILYPIRINELIDLIAPHYSSLIMSLLSKLSKGICLAARKQDEGEASYSIWLDSSDYLLDWRNSADELAHKINLLGAPYKNAQSFMNNNLINVQAAEVYKNLTVERRHIGKVLIVEDGCPVIICGEGLLKITQMTDENEKNLIPFKFFRVRFN